MIVRRHWCCPDGQTWSWTSLQKGEGGGAGRNGALVAARYVNRGYWRGRPLGHWLWQWADQHPERISLVDGEVRLSYRELAVRADALAVRLADRGLGSGDALLVQLPNCWQFVVLFFACTRLGVAPVMALLPHRAQELTHLAEHAQAAAIAVPDRWSGFDHATLAAQVAAAVPTVRQVLVLGGDLDERAGLRIGLRTRCAPSWTSARRTAATWRCSCFPGAPPGCPS
ncbi:MAG: AMP-binding protein [Pseudonocardiaceae bacterium]